LWRAASTRAMAQRQHCTGDESARCCGGPSDVDRARFGFHQRASVGSRRRPSQFEFTPRDPLSLSAPSGPRRVSCEPEEEHPVVDPLGAPTSEEAASSSSSSTSAIEIVSLLQSTLGDPDEALPLLRARSAVSKFDFKGRIAELSNQNRQLRAALASKRDGHRSLAETLSQLQAELNWKLRSNKAEVQTARAQIDDRSKIAEMLQEAVRAVWREEAACAEHLTRTPNAVGGLNESQCSDAQDQVAALKQCCTAEASRAALAEAVAQERERELALAKAEVAEQRENAAAAHEKAAQATRLVKKAGDLLRLQEEELRRQHMEEKALAAAREQALALQLAQAEARIQVLDAKLAAAPARVPPTAPHAVSCRACSASPPAHGAARASAIIAAASPQKGAARCAGH